MCFQNIISYQYQIPLRCLYLYWQSQLFISNQIYLISYCTVELPDTTWYSHVFTNHIEVSKVSCLQWHVSSIELNMQLRDILNHLKPTAEAAAWTSVFVHLILGQNTYMCFTTLGALPKHFFGFDIPSRSGQPQLSNLTLISTINTKKTLFQVTNGTAAAGSSGTAGSSSTSSCTCCRSAGMAASKNATVLAPSSSLSAVGCGTSS